MMQTALKKRRAPSSRPPKREIVGGQVKFLPPSYTDRVSSTKHIHRGIIGHIVDQPVVVISREVDSDGCVRVLKACLQPLLPLTSEPQLTSPVRFY